jgi:hypothetical protein
VNFQLGDADLETMIATGIRTGFGDEWVRIGATQEHTVDGSFSERTMSISTGYPSRPGYKGNVTTTQEALDAWVERVHRARIQGQLSRERRRSHRHDDESGRACAAAVPRQGCSTEDHTLHAHQR